MLPIAAFVLTSCDDSESYAELLRDESQAVNYFLAGYPVIDEPPVDSVFITTQDIMAEDSTLTRDEAIALTPFYRMDDDSYVYMQVINPGNGTMAIDEQTICFRFTRYNLIYFQEDGTWSGTGNSSNLGATSTTFKFRNTTLTSTTQWGEGIQVPLEWLSLNCEVRVVIKSYLGPTEEVTSVYPYLYEVRYFPAKQL